MERHRGFTICTALRAATCLALVLIGSPLTASSPREETAREFLSAVEAGDQPRINQLTTEWIYAARTTCDKHITLARKQDEVLGGFRRHFKNVKFTLGEFTHEGDFSFVCASGQFKGRTVHWLTSFEFRDQLIKNLLFQEESPLCEPPQER